MGFGATQLLPDKGASESRLLLDAGSQPRTALAGIEPAVSLQESGWFTVVARFGTVGVVSRIATARTANDSVLDRPHEVLLCRG